MDAIATFCRKWHVSELALFGSVLREDFGPESDIDVLITFEPGDTWTFADLADMRQELETIFGRSVDMLEHRAVERARNPFFRDNVLSRAEPLYVA